MAHTYNGTGVKVDGDFTIPDAEYNLVITHAVEGKSKNGDYMVTVHYKVLDGEHKGFPVKYHRVTFLPPQHKGAGIALHYLKTIGQPWEGEFTIEPSNWVENTLTAYLAAKEFNGKRNMDVKWVKPLSSEAKPVDEEVPF